MANIKSKTEARKKVREAQAKANEARQERERHNVDDAASFLVELGGWRQSTSGSRAVWPKFAQRASGGGTSTARRARLGCRACWIAGNL
jgi:hypothetical protein